MVIGIRMSITDFAWNSKLHIQDRFSCIAVVFRRGSQKHLLQESPCLPHNGVPVLLNILQVLRCRFSGFTSGSDKVSSGMIWEAVASADGHIPRPAPLLSLQCRFQFFLQYPDPVKQRIQIGLHNRLTELYQSDFHQHPLL